jgi:hypothetical protein
LFLGGPRVELRAQIPPTDPPTNSRVRITAPDLNVEPIIGTIVEKRAETWIVDSEIAGVVPFEVPLVSVTRIEVSRGFQRKTAKGLGIGVLVGSVAGVLIGYAQGDDDCRAEREAKSFCLEVMSAGDKAAIFGLGLGVVGGVIGAALGRYPTEQWEEAALPRPALGLSLAEHRGVALFLTVRF